MGVLMQTGSTDGWNRSDPESQGIHSASILGFLRRIEADDLELHGLMIVRGGHVVAEGAWAPYRLDDPHALNSLSKSFTSTAIGLAAEEGKLSIDDSVISFFPEEVTPAIADNMKDLKVRHLLSMTTGHTVDTIPIMHGSPHGNWVKAFLETPIERPPGTHFLYNTGASYMLSAILYRATGEQLLDWLRPRLFEPLGIAGVSTFVCPRGIHAGGYGMFMSVSDIAKFGQLYLQEGVWEGKRILPAEWVRTATSRQADNGDDPSSDWAQGYGFQFWRCRHGAYRGDGAFGQFCVVIPHKQAVVAMTAGAMEMQDILNAVWEELLPGMEDAPIGRPDAAAQRELAERLRALAYPAAPSAKAGDEARWSGKTWQVADNPTGIRTLKLTFADGGAGLEIGIADVTQRIRIGHGEWADGAIRIGGFEVPLSASGRWIRRNVYEIDLRFLGQAFHDRLTCHFVDNRLQVSVTRNVWIMPGLSDPLLPPTLMAESLK
jgi:Beta-lactamase class C and other penicillin binding proteins